MLLQKLKPTICQMIRSTVVSKKQQVDVDAVNYEEVTYEGYGPNGIGDHCKSV